jgi:hypothetical protein
MITGETDRARRGFLEMKRPGTGPGRLGIRFVSTYLAGAGAGAGAAPPAGAPPPAGAAAGAAGAAASAFGRGFGLSDSVRR